MMRSLWTAASGMITQQTNVDTISNNIANINTTGFKKESAEFKSLLYQNLQKETTDNQGNVKPVGAQVGSGVRNSAITSNFEQGPLTQTGNMTDFAIYGSGFFMVQLPDGSIGYTRDGSFQTALVDGATALADANGNIVLDSNGNPITIGRQYDITKMQVDEAGYLTFPNENGNATRIGIRIGLAQFANPAGLEKMSGGMFKETVASGAATIEGQNGGITESQIKQGYLESSNVQAVDEMVNLIVAQRAYEMNSKAIQAADSMMQQANNLR